MIRLLGTFSLLMIMVLPGSAITAESEQTFELSSVAFVEEAFGGVVPVAERVWIRNELLDQVETILQHQSSFLRTKYWLKNNLSVWILDEIGKEKPITIGIVAQHKEGVSKIVDVQVLAFRESRGWEVKHTFFTDQFAGVRRLIKGRNSRLEPEVDGITGATLSVRAVEKAAEIALLLDEHVRKKEI